MKELEFLEKLKEELNNQETDCQANPRFWVVAQYEYQPCWEEQADEHYIYYDEESYKTFDDLLNCLIENEYIDSKNGYDDLSDLENIIDGAYEVPVKKVHVIKQDTMFLTKRECQDHIERNNYHYNDTVHTYAMTAWRSPQVEKLLNTIQKTNWKDLEVIK